MPRVKAAGTTPRRVGTWLVFASFALAQFVDFSFFEVGNFDVSLQKVVALIVFPVAFVLMRQIRFPLPLVVLAVALILANSATYIIESDLFDTKLLSANATVLSGFLGATVLYTALTQDEEGFSSLGHLWVAFAAATSVLVLGQVVGLLPLWAVPGEELQQRMAGVGGLYRGTGLRFDPNLQALALALGIVFARFYVTKLKVPLALLIMLGIIGTFSRMGLLVAILAWVTAPVLRAWAAQTAWGMALLRLLGTGAVLAITLAGVYAASPQEVRSYLDQRVEETTTGYDYFASGAPSASAGLTSSEERVLLVRASLQVLSQNNYLLGVGAYNTPEVLHTVVGKDRVAHNTYLEELLIGGALGMLAIILYVAYVARAITKSRRLKGEENRRSFTLTLLFAFGLIGALLTLNYTSILWLPLVVALADLRMAHLERYGA